MDGYQELYERVGIILAYAKYMKSNRCQLTLFSLYTAALKYIFVELAG